MKLLTIIGLVFLLSIGSAKSQELLQATSPDRKIEKYADYPGGVDKLYEYIKRNLRYPEDALRDSITGDVYVEFRINSEGVVVSESIKVISSVSRSCDAEAIRLIKSSSAWIPARSKRGAEEQYISFPVSFRWP